MNAGQATTIVREALRALPGIAVAQSDWNRAVREVNDRSARESARRPGRERTRGERRPVGVYPDALLTVRSTQLDDGTVLTIVRHPGCPRTGVHPRVRREVERVAAEHGAVYREPDGVRFMLFGTVEIEWPPRVAHR